MPTASGNLPEASGRSAVRFMRASVLRSSASFSAPCDNCAFRPESPEQADTAKWKELIAKLRAGGAFHCHKGVPIAPKSEDGFAYPKHKPEKLRLCRGYLNALGKWWGAAEPDQSKAPGKEPESES